MADITDAYNLFHEGIRVFARMEQSGIRIDTDFIKSKKEWIDNEIVNNEKLFLTSKLGKEWQNKTKTKINIYSNDQLEKFLYGIKNLKSPKETKTGKGSVDEEALQELNLPDLQFLLRIKKLKKMKDYLELFERESINGFIHPFYNLHLVRSYRSSADSPNFQNIPRRDKEAMEMTRRAIYPRLGHQLMEVDFKQLEVRIAACYCQDEVLIRDILEGDMHRDMACEIFKIRKYNPEDKSHKVLRNAAKNGFVFPEFYGDYYKNCAINLAYNWGQLSKVSSWKKGQGIEFEDRHLADHLIENGFKNLDRFTQHIKEIEYSFWNKRYRTYNQWKDWFFANYQRDGYIESKTGFTYRGIMKRNDVLNYPIQGAAFHCLLWSLIEIMKAQKREHWDSRIVGQIHDSIIIDANPEEVDYVVKVVKCIMTHDLQAKWNWITIPLDIDIEICDVDKSWADKKDYEAYKTKQASTKTI